MPAGGPETRVGSFFRVHGRSGQTRRGGGRFRRPLRVRGPDVDAKLKASLTACPAGGGCVCSCSACALCVMEMERTRRATDNASAKACPSDYRPALRCNCPC